MFKAAEIGYDKFFSAAREIGYPAVENWGRGSDFDDLCRAAGKTGLKIASMAGHGGPHAGLNDRSAHGEVEKQLKASIDIAADRGIRGVFAFSGNRREGLTDEQGIDITAEGLARIAPYAEKKGVYVNLELLNSKVDHKGYQCDRAAWGVAVVSKVACPRVRLLFDIYHVQIMEGDIIRTIRDNIRWIAHFHTAGNPGRGEFDDDQELNYRGICKAIAATDYDGYVGHEFRPGRDVMQSLRKAFAICDVS
jgi:hydroxypyruvate isomerase